MDTRRFILAMTLSFAVMYGWALYQQHVNPPKPPQTQPVAQAATSQPAVQSQAAMTATQPAEATQPTWHAKGADTTQEVTLGQDDPAGTYEIQAFLTTRGAAVERILMVGKSGKTRDGQAKYVYSAKVDENTPYQVIDPLELPSGDKQFSWQTASIRIGNPEVTVPLADVPWNVETSRGQDGTFQARFWVDIYNAQQQPVVQVVKRFTLAPRTFGMTMDLTFRSLNGQEVSLVVDQLGALGIRREDPRSDNRKIYVVTKDEDRFKPEVFQHAGLVKKAAVEIGSAMPISWTALVDKYFAAITAPDRAVGADKAIASAKVFTFTHDPQVAEMGGDIGIQLLSPAMTATAAKPAQLVYDLYVCPKTVEALSAAPQYAARNYALLRSAEYAWCTFSSLGEMLTSFLHVLYSYIWPHNYGLAIIILVLLVRAILHPLTKHQQMSMSQMQQKQATVAPKVAALKQKYPNDRQKQQLEMMKVYREAGINPAAQMAGCLPMVIQLPIWVALYSALNYDINLWHAPFLLWIRDLSAPDALFHWSPAVNVPLLSFILGPVSNFNLLPILLAGSMWLQQKYTPKPTPAPDTPPDQLAQQQQMQKMMSFMMVFMGIMFYNMPSGLNLYIMASSAFGALEQQRIRKHMEERKKDPDFGKPKTGGWMEKLMAKMEKKAAASHTFRREKDKDE